MHNFVYRIEPDHDGINIGTYLRRKHGFSRSQVQKIKRSGDVTVNGKQQPLWHKLSKGDLLKVVAEEEQEQLIEPQEIPFQVLFEDDYLLVVNKPAGLVVHPTKGVTSGTLANGVVHYWQQKGQDFIFRAVSRLDRDTSGVIVIAKHPYVQEALTKQSQRDEWQKFYVAVVQGVLASKQGEIDAPIAKVEGSAARVISRDGKPSRTLWKVRHQYKAAALVEAQLVTGRTHQIRVHFAHIGHPLLGDTLYGKASSLIARQALHASRLIFTHPVEKHTMELEAPLPEDMLKLLELID